MAFFKNFLRVVSNQFKVVFCSLLKYFNRSIAPVDGTLASNTPPGQSRPGSNGNDGVLLPELQN